MTRNLLRGLTVAGALLLPAACAEAPAPMSPDVLRAAKGGGKTQSTAVTAFLTGAFLMPAEGQAAEILSEEPVADIDGADTDAEKGANDWANNTRVGFNLQYTQAALEQPGGLDACAYNTDDPVRQEELRTDLMRFLVSADQGRGWSMDIDVAAAGAASIANVIRNGWFDGTRGPLHLHVGSDALFPGSTSCDAIGADEWRCAGGVVVFRDRSGKPNTHARIVCPVDPLDAWTLRLERA